VPISTQSHRAHLSLCDICLSDWEGVPCNLLRGREREIRNRRKRSPPTNRGAGDAEGTERLTSIALAFTRFGEPMQHVDPFPLVAKRTLIAQISMSVREFLIAP
jgi:hypothetical protein